MNLHLKMGTRSAIKWLTPQRAREISVLSRNRSNGLRQRAEEIRSSVDNLWAGFRWKCENDPSFINNPELVQVIEDELRESCRIRIENAVSLEECAGQWEMLDAHVMLGAK